MWNGKKKAVTLSFDDGVTQDIRLIEILKKYGLKATFNLNSGLMGKEGSLPLTHGEPIRHDKIAAERAKSVYDGFEVAVHTVNHFNLTTLTKEQIVDEVERDRKALASLFGREIVGMAYPCGEVNNDERVAEIIRRNTPVRYARTITSTHTFDLQENLLRFHPTVYYIEDCFEKIVDRFLALDGEKLHAPQLLYIWGHSYEMDAGFISWEKFERICKKLARRADIFYGSNCEVLLGK